MTARCLWLVYQSFEWRWCFIAEMFKVQQSYGSHLLFCILHESWENRKDAVFPILLTNWMDLLNMMQYHLHNTYCVYPCTLPPGAY